MVEPAEDTATFAIEVAGQVVGLIQYWEETDPDYRHAGIDVALDPAWHGRGLGADAVRTVTRHLFERRGHHRITIDPRPTTSARSAPTSASGSDRSGSCAATNGAPTAPGTTAC